MVFSSLTFLCIFLPCILILDRIFRNIRIKNALLLVASLLFYAYGEPVYVFLMAASALLNFVSALLIDKFKDNLKLKKTFLFIGVIVNLGALVFFKYTVFLVTFVNSTFSLSVPVPDVTLPLGISFFTFQAMSYVIDVYRGDCNVQKNFGRLLLYISFFPQLIAGPIVKYRDIEAQILSRCVTSDNTALGIRRFAMGLAKKVFIANNVAVIADTIFGDLGVIDAKTAWLGAAAYMLQIFFDFSGYSDMAIGLGLMFGFKFKENFDHPYIASSIKEFWRRWHISLSSWFKEYLYIPLGGNRKGKARTIINKFIVFACTGIWHGANWTFLLWGLYHGAFLMIEEFIPKKEKKNAFVKILSHVYLVFVVLIGFVLFRCDSISDFGVMISRMFSFTGTIDSTMMFMKLVNPMNLTALAAGVIFSMPVADKFKDKKSLQGLSYIASICAVVLAMLCLSSGSYNPFIYFRF